MADFVVTGPLGIVDGLQYSRSTGARPGADADGGYGGTTPVGSGAGIPYAAGVGIPYATGAGGGGTTGGPKRGAGGGTGGTGGGADGATPPVARGSRRWSRGPAPPRGRAPRRMVALVADAEQQVPAGLALSHPAVSGVATTR